MISSYIMTRDDIINQMWRLGSKIVVENDLQLETAWRTSATKSILLVMADVCAISELQL